MKKFDVFFIVSLLLTVFIFASCSQKKKTPPEPFKNTDFSSAAIKVAFYQTDVLVTRPDSMTDRGWGYDIYVNDSIFVKQPYIPSIAKKSSFITKDYATKTALLVVQKIRNKKIPPTISKHELDSLGVLK